MKVYILKAYNLKHAYTIENTVFTSKKKALNSRLKLIDYLVNNHNLNVNDIEVSWQDDKISILILDSAFALEVKTYQVNNKVNQYIH
jgi:hypothetical protein